MAAGGAERADPRGRGPVAVVTPDIGILRPRFARRTDSHRPAPGKTVEMARENTGWDLQAAPQLRITEPVTERELQILREELDPGGIYLKSAG